MNSRPLGLGLSLGGLGKPRVPVMPGKLTPSLKAAIKPEEPKEPPAPLIVQEPAKPALSKLGPQSISPLIPANSEEQEMLADCQHARANIDALLKERKNLQKEHRDWLANRKKLICQVRSETNRIRNPNGPTSPRLSIGFTLETM